MESERALVTTEPAALAPVIVGWLGCGGWGLRGVVVKGGGLAPVLDSWGVGGLVKGGGGLGACHSWTVGQLDRGVCVGGGGEGKGRGGEGFPQPSMRPHNE